MFFEWTITLSSLEGLCYCNYNHPSVFLSALKHDIYACFFFKYFWNKFDFYILFIHEVTLFLMISLIMLIMQSLFA